MNKRLILLSNDDGVESEGILKLREAVSHLGDVYIVAPDKERSGASHSITLGQPIRVKQLDDKVFSVSGTPADCVLLGIFELLPGKPDLVLSGINRGYNLGEDVFYSGTVAAAREGAIYDIPALAISLGTSTSEYYWETAKYFTKVIIDEIFKSRLDFELININIPNKPRDEIRGIRIVRLGRRSYQDPVDKREDNIYYIGGEPLWRKEPGTDLKAVSDGFVSITPLNIDLTDYDELKRLQWDLTF